MGNKKGNGGGDIKNRELLKGKNELPLKDGVNDKTIKETLKQRKGLKRTKTVRRINK